METIKSILFVTVTPVILLTVFFTDVIHNEPIRKPAVEIVYLKAFSNGMK